MVLASLMADVIESALGLGPWFSLVVSTFIPLNFIGPPNSTFNTLAEMEQVLMQLCKG